MLLLLRGLWCPRVRLCVSTTYVVVSELGRSSGVFRVSLTAVWCRCTVVAVLAERYVHHVNARQGRLHCPAAGLLNALMVVRPGRAGAELTLLSMMCSAGSGHVMRSVCVVDPGAADQPEAKFVK